MNNNYLKSISLLALLSFIFSIFLISSSSLADEAIWVRALHGEIINGEGEWENDYCGGKYGHAWAMTEGTWVINTYADYDSCPSEEYDLTSTVDFDAPPLLIPAGGTVNLQALGVKSGFQNCCTLVDWFKYKVNCAGASITGDNDIVSLFVNPVPEGGWSGQLHDDLEVDLTMPTGGDECVVSGVSSHGYVRWVYNYTVVTQQPNTRITGISGKYMYVTNDNKLQDIVIELSNSGNASDSGTIEITFPYDINRYFPDKVSIPYSISANEQKSYRYGVTFPERIKSESAVCTDEVDPPIFTVVSVRADSKSNLDGTESMKERWFKVSCSDKVIFPPLSSIIERLLKKKIGNN